MVDSDALKGLQGGVFGESPSCVDDLWVDFLFDELLGLTKELSSQHHHGGGTVSYFLVLDFGDVHENFGGWVIDVKRLENGGTVIRHGDILGLRSSD